LNARAYYQSLQQEITASPLVMSSSLSFTEIDLNECYIRGSLLLLNQSELHIAEYVVTEPPPHRLKYRYHLQDRDGRLLSRWDNAPHHRSVPTFPHHRHNADRDVEPAEPIDVSQILQLLISWFGADDDMSQDSRI
jgi:hypothetical protein